MDPGIGGSQLQLEFFLTVGGVVGNGGSGSQSIDFLDEISVLISESGEGAFGINTGVLSLEIAPFHGEDPLKQQIDLSFSLPSVAGQPAPIVA